MIITADLLENYVLKDLPRSAYLIQEENSQNGPVTRIVPSNPRAAQLSVWINPYGSCDISFGRAFQRELNLEEGDDLIALANAVIHGCIIERIWTLGRHRLYSKSTIQLENAEAVMRDGMWLFYPPWLKHKYTYEPFVSPTLTPPNPTPPKADQ